MRIRNSLGAAALAAMMGATALSGVAVAQQGAVEAPVPAVSAGGYVDLVEAVSPAVVYIEVTAQAPAAQPARMPPEFEEFARRFGLPMPEAPQRQGRQMQGVGAGFIISADGQVVTNAHVVAGADTVTVKLSDGRSLQAEVLGTDTATDLALLKVTADEDLPFVRFGDSTQLKVGQDVVAIGNPFGLGNTVTAGIVSALGRDINAGPFDNFIQTDAAINRGNSGGPLFNAAGEVVGINTAIFSPSGGSVGIGFAVPSEIATRVVGDLAEKGAVERGWLGVAIQPVTEDIAAALGFEAAQGVLISEVTPDAPAAKAGLKRGDVVLSVDGAKVDSPRTLTRLVGAAAPGTEVVLEVLRGGEPMDLPVKLGNRADLPT